MKTGADDTLESLGYLPRYFRAELERPAAFQEHPVRWLLQTFEANVHLVERIAENSALLADPWALAEFPIIVGSSHLSVGEKRMPAGATLGKADACEWERQQLDWLASWLVLDLDPEWLSESDIQPDAASETAAKSHPARRFAKAREIIGKIAPLYTRRGTPEGLRDMIRLLFDLDVEILEHSSLRGAEIGVRSTIGKDFWLTDPPDPELDFVVLIRSKEGEARHLRLHGAGIPSMLVGAREKRPVVCLARRGRRAKEEHSGSSADIEAFIVKLCDLIEREKPAHTRCYLALVATPESKSRAIHKMVIGINSVIGNFLIN